MNSTGRFLPLGLGTPLDIYDRRDSSNSCPRNHSLDIWMKNTQVSECPCVWAWTLVIGLSAAGLSPAGLAGTRLTLVVSLP